MRIYLILFIFLYASASYSSISVDLENGLGVGSSSSLSVKRSDFYSIKASYGEVSPDAFINWQPVVSIGETQNTYFGSHSEFSSMMKLEETVLGLGLNARFTLFKISWVTELMAQKSIGTLRINRSSTSSTQIAQISRVPSTGFTFTAKSEFPISEPVTAFVGLQLRQSQAKVENFPYEQTSAVNSGLNLSQGVNGSSDLNIPSKLKTKASSVIFGLSLNI